MSGTSPHEAKEICVLGGFGAMGRAVVEHLLRSSDVRILIADRQELDVPRLFPYAGDRVRATQIDAIRPESIKGAVESSDLVINCIGPYYRYGTIIARAVIELGKSGVDLCNNPGTTNGILGLDALAKELGVTMVTGAGFTPGLSNLLVMKAAYQMERIDDISIHWASSIFQRGGESMLDHFLTLGAGDVPAYRNRLRTRVKAFSEPESEKFPHPIGLTRVAHTGHPEVVTLPLYVDTASVTVKGALLPGWLQQVAALSGRSGITGTEQFRRRYSAALNRVSGLLSPFRGHEEGLTALKVNVKGIKLGQPVVVALNTMGALVDLTALPAVTTALFILKGRITQPGVYPPEGCVDEERALIHMSRYGLVYTFSERFLAL